jgi:peroxiredoxin
LALSYTLEIGKNAPDLSLIGTDGMIHTLNEYKGSRAIVVMFLCNHCPYVRGCEEYLRKLAEGYRRRGVAFIAINSNSVLTEPEDSYNEMTRLMEEKDFPWVYLHDPSQQIALKFGALCTPHFFLFDQNRILVYTGRALDNPKRPKESSTDDLKNALDQLLDLGPITMPQTNPIGCTIKWNGMSAEACSLV